MSTIFRKILDGEIPADIVHEDDQCIAFRDIRPVAPFHVLVIPRKEIDRASSLQPEDEALMGHLVRIGTQVARAAGYDDCRLTMNNGAGAGQTVFHLHLHVVAGRPLTWPPG